MRDNRHKAAELLGPLLLFLLFAAAALIMYIVFKDIFNLIPIYTAAAIIINVLSAADFTLRYRKA